MEVMVANALDEIIHVSVVRHSTCAVELIISTERMPIPCGTVLRHEYLEPEHALLMNGFDDETEFQASFEGFTGTIRANLVQGKNDEGPFARLTLLERKPADDGG